MTVSSVSHRVRRQGTGNRWCRFWRDERGQVTAELVIIMPLLMTLILVIAQVALWAQATHIAQAAASEALSATRVQGGTVQAGDAEAAQVLAQLGTATLRDPRVTVTRDAARASVTVHGSASAVVPFLQLPVHAEAAGPVEAFRDIGTAP